MTRIAVIDFETTGSTPGRGARATEIAIVMVEDGQITGSFQSLMNGGVWIPPFITQLTGISNDMVAAAPPAQDVMREAHGFVGDAPMVAHNAAFDQSFWRAELARADLQPAHAFACTVRLSRRLFPNAPNHKLGTLLHYHGIASAGPAHRALADASVTAHMLLRMQTHLQLHWDIETPDHAFLRALQACSAARVHDFLLRNSRGAPSTPHAASPPGYARTKLSKRPL